MATINKHNEAVFTANPVTDRGDNMGRTAVQNFDETHSESAKSETRFNASVFSWMFDKFLSYYVLMVVSLLLLKYFEIISLSGFLVGLFSAFGISLALLGHGFSKLTRHAKKTQHGQHYDKHISG
ncbi:hypothetical protein [Fodinibius sp. Rm-B-1B1-1]|uniref:hypothetical protein n=1 Tax=Fodinibius alkaliphilus TaxID=3140241 RepID=UPI003159C795